MTSAKIQPYTWPPVHSTTDARQLTEDCEFHIIGLDTHHQNVRSEEDCSQIVGFAVANDKPSESAHEEIAFMVEGKTRNDLVIIYFHGSAGFIDKKYSFKFQGNKSGYFNAYQLIWRLSISEASCLFLLDRDVYTRVATQWEARFPLAEVIGRGAAYQDPDLATINTHHDFALCFLHNLRGFVNQYKVEDGGKPKGKQPRTIPQLMQFDRKLVSNPVRVKSRRAKCRYVHVDSQIAHEHGKIHFGFMETEDEQDLPPAATAALVAAIAAPVYRSGSGKPGPIITNPLFIRGPSMFNDDGYFSSDEGPLFVPK
ncbi:hypothetical protein Slin14017_G054180 [Septoria linicola]|nr:hypothetical protein Slin14017_G054180 [Septoria linicola]